MEADPKQTKSGGGVVLNTEGKVLVVSQRGISWSLPKGHIDPGEDAMAAARREIWEESGVKELEFVKELGSYQRFRIDKDGGEDRSEFKTITIFLFRTSQDRLEPVDDHNPEARWIDKDEVAQLLTHPKDADFFRSVKEDLN